ncbi:MAG: hypothetical protein ACJ75F_09835 [Flavisolibacter sp.]
MKAYLFFLTFLATTLCSAQNNNVSTLPAGKYETIIKDNQLKWERGDIIILDQAKYKLSTSNDVGDYKFSITAQRIFFTSGPLKSMYARTSLSNDTPAILLPLSENEQIGNKLPSEVWCYYRH